ncbi:MAG TPA: hypothetical protein VK689_22265 [Armatimonadota bacterium]|nr:hypothetical protein [Armatimonadota bacterium]
MDVSRPDPLPTEPQRKSLCKMIQHAFVEIRILGWAGKSQQAADLADTFHNIPMEMHGVGFFSWSRFRRDLTAYQAKYANVDRLHTPYNYTAVLDEIAGQ